MLLVMKSLEQGSVTAESNGKVVSVFSVAQLTPVRQRENFCTLAETKGSTDDCILEIEKKIGKPEARTVHGVSGLSDKKEVSLFSENDIDIRTLYWIKCLHSENTVVGRWCKGTESNENLRLCPPRNKLR